jgi:hypothetical protein
MTTAASSASSPRPTAVFVGSFAAVGLLPNLGHGVGGWGPPALTLSVLVGVYLGLRLLRDHRRRAASAG